VIGRDNDLPWRLPDDLKHFKQLTSGHTVVMGRRTWESIGARPLPNRRHIVISRDSGYQATGATVAGSLDAALKLAAGDAEVFIIGGQQIYALALPIADRLYLTEVDADVPGDVRFPALNRGLWRVVDEVAHPADERHAFAFRFLTLDRR
jgi:dihydrofolate reductase